MKKFFTVILLIGLGIGGTLGFQHYVLNVEVSVSADSTHAVDTAKVVKEISPVMQPSSVADSTNDSIKK